MAAEGMEVGEAYSNAIEQILANPVLGTWEWLVTWEHDNLPPQDGIINLIKRAEDHPEFLCIGGLYWVKGAGGPPQIWGDISDAVMNFRPQPPRPGELVECWGTGMGFNLWRLQRLRNPALPRPLFRTKASKEEGVGTQDLAFWGEARKHGFRCAVDCAVRVGHLDPASGFVW
jgi:hypothetical protein